jgi:hypothetical protein
VVSTGKTLSYPGNKETTMMNLKKLTAATAICVVLALWAVALARPAATHKASGGDTFADSVDYATDGAVAQYWAVEDFIDYE